MKKFLTVAVSAVLAFGCISGAAYSETHAEAAGATEEHAVYLVPGSYTDKKTGQTVYNTVDGATKLTDEESEAISTPNVYRFDGEALPEPATTREGVVFNGWWTIEDAEIVYHETAPETSKTVYLYADWRADLSQPKDPIIPDEGEEVVYAHYMEITRALTGKKEKVQLFVSGTDVPNAVQAGYGGPVQFYNEWFLLEPGDMVRIYVSKVYGAEPTLAPQLRGARKITMESGWLKPQTDDATSQTNGFPGDYANSIHGEPRMLYSGKKTPYSTEEPQAHHCRIYVKFYDNGGTMTVYVQNQD